MSEDFYDEDEGFKMYKKDLIIPKKFRTKDFSIENYCLENSFNNVLWIDDIIFTAKKKRNIHILSPKRVILEIKKSESSFLKAKVRTKVFGRPKGTSKLKGLESKIDESNILL